MKHSALMGDVGEVVLGVQPLIEDYAWSPIPRESAAIASDVQSAKNARAFHGKYKDLFAKDRQEYFTQLRLQYRR